MVHLTPSQLEVIREIRHEWPDTPLALIGALALGAHIDMSYRQTEDVDLALAISMDAFPAGLPGRPGWKQVAGREHNFLGPSGQAVDLLPAGPELISMGQLRWASGHTMSLVGFDLDFQAAEDVTIEDVSFRLPCAAALAFLKVRAWLDRPSERAKDLRDLAHLLRDYVPDDDMRRWEESYPEGLEFDDLSAFFLGRDLTTICADHHRPHIDLFLEKVSSSALAGHGPWVLEPGDEAERAIKALSRGWLP
ncbi:MAG: hypothetical protein KC619_24275 [Myxococcales bacterium]|nr:hypothetical protein [Myxococcales bacterium]